LTGGVVYYGSKLPDLRGAYIYGDYSTGRIWGGRHDGQRMVWHRELARTPFAITGFGTDENGELLVIDEGSGFYRFEPTPTGEAPRNSFPRKLSETGLFISVPDHRPDPALIPYSVNSPLWSDGASKERFIALPGNGKIDFTYNRAWTLPEGTVLVKTFELEMRPGEAASRKRIETRLLTKQQKEWVGYSYIWNDEQTEAVLVEGSGRDKDFFIRDETVAGGRRKQTWHYPSRTECMVCHSRAAGFMLGLTEAQINKTHQYTATSDNQLRVLEHLGVLQSKALDYERDAIPRELAAAGIKGQELSREMEVLTPARSQREAPAEPGALLPRRPENLRKLADPADASASLNDRARSYLQANCAHCHVEAGGGNSLMDLEFLTAPEKMRIFDVRPQHHTFEITDARLIAPGHPEKSVLLHRISNREAGHMPPLATSLVDRDAVALITSWINQLKPAAN
jgi:mono/diheme cytochrome c family protein